eukprot:TRINITY_DN2382_c0_g1_i2.p1 TRINITY_DN2382_c0_g1~~TRINITY_DN2382_c0_g1_i2.p1  ORF type:complete len:208 (+),score=25.91 TRINITY_DN2382_c0_g1_i2:52-624(+)
MSPEIRKERSQVRLQIPLRHSGSLFSLDSSTFDLDGLGTSSTQRNNNTIISITANNKEISEKYDGHVLPNPIRANFIKRKKLTRSRTSSSFRQIHNAIITPSPVDKQDADSSTLSCDSETEDIPVLKRKAKSLTPKKYKDSTLSRSFSSTFKQSPLATLSPKRISRSLTNLYHSDVKDDLKELITNTTKV